jgi:inosine-uridine nucleoside N-ribohydrolase
LLEPPARKCQVVIDTDTYNEIDDQYAVAYAILSPQRMEVEAVYAAPYLNNRSKSAGDGMEKSYEEILRVLERLGRTDFRAVYRGSRDFMVAAGKPVESPAAKSLVERALGSDRMLYALTVGAPTNVSSAILMEPRVMKRITVVWLGGQPYHHPSAREFNLMQDLHASRVLFDSGVPLMNIPTTNVSEQLRTTTAELDRFVRGKSRIGGYLCEIFEEHARENKRDFSQPWSKVIWDISAVAWAVQPRWIDSQVVSSPILNDDLTWKETAGRHPVRVATHVNRDAIFGDLFARLAASGGS